MILSTLSMRATPATGVLIALSLAACSPTTSGDSSHVSAFAPSSTDTELVFTKQTASVSTKCLDPRLKTALAALKDRLGATPIITSGHRERGSRKGSYHPKCMAADIQVPGRSPSEVAKAARAYAGIGGVGTYCHTRSVHIDVGPKRSWHWNC